MHQSTIYTHLLIAKGLWGGDWSQSQLSLCFDHRGHRSFPLQARTTKDTQRQVDILLCILPVPLQPSCGGKGLSECCFFRSNCALLALPEGRGAPLSLGFTTKDKQLRSNKGGRKEQTGRWVEGITWKLFFFFAVSLHHRYLPK